MYNPSGEVRMTIHSSSVAVKSDGQIVNVSIPDGYVAYLKYKPQHMNSAVF